MSDVSIVLAGEAGQGVQSIEAILVDVLKKEGFHVYATKEYMSRVRGGINSTLIRISDKPVKALIDRIDLLVPLNKEAIAHLSKRISAGTAVLGDKVSIGYEKIINVPFNRIASEFGNPIYASSVATGTICGIVGAGFETLSAAIAARFGAKDEEVRNKNIEAAKSGFEIGKQLVENGVVNIKAQKDPAALKNAIMTGAEAAALGAIAGGCDCVFAYPMTPGTSMFTALAGYAKEAGISVEQVEDEIGVINMAIAAWYAGGRAVVATSGGGFALMTEGVSLAGMTETPCVIYLSQRPAPATGLPTRTEQGDINLALYAGHGEFPRIIIAPSTIEEAFYLTQKAMNLADKHQSPVFVLVDQYFADTYHDLPAFDLSQVKNEKYIVKTQADYKRYKITPDGLSPRGVPGFGEGTVCADSDEHDESGRITEDLDNVRVPMADKRLRKMENIKKETTMPKLEGAADYEELFISWGSTYNIIKEAFDTVKKPKAAMLHFSWIYPLPEAAGAMIKKAKKVTVIENNQAGQFADLLEKTYLIPLKNRVLKYNGLAFSVEEVIKRINDF